MESTEESSWLAAVNGEEATNGDSVVSPVGGRFVPACVPSSDIVFMMEGVLLSSTGFEMR